MADFAIRPHRTIWRHGRTWHAGQEDALEKAGFPPEQKAIKMRGGVIDWDDAPADDAPADDAPADDAPADDAGSEINATDSALALAAAHNLDLGSITGTGTGGRIIKRDVEALLD